MTRQAYKIVTHPGIPHMDDLVTTCIVLAVDHGIGEVCRRAVTEHDLQNPDIWVLDIGKQHDAEMLNFDHHQFPANTEECTLSLVCRHLGLEPELQKTDWYNLIVLMDALGPRGTGEKLTCDPEVLRQTTSPIDEFLLASFEQSSVINRDDPLFVLLKKIGTYIVDQIEASRNRLELLREKATLHTIDGLQAVLFLEIIDDAFLAIDQFCEEIEGEIAFLVVNNTRGEGWALRRHKDHYRVDFNRIKDQPDVDFVHSSGFVAKVPRLEKSRILELLELSLSR